MDSLITANHLNVIRQGKHILKDVSLSIKPNEFITIIGPNGAGKSMLLKCLMGFYKPDEGNVTQKKGLKVGYVPQRFIPDPTMPITAKRFLKIKKKVKPDDLDQIIHDTNLENILEKPISILSGGEFQRVLLARSLLDHPEIIILDEPAQNLDISGQISFYKLLERVYHERSLSILMVSHDLHMVMASTNQVICLYHHICCSGQPNMVTKDPKFISLFGHEMANMMAMYQHHHSHTHDD
jgi:zinc transport system ATP-binding protein